MKKTARRNDDGSADDKRPKKHPKILSSYDFYEIDLPVAPCGQYLISLFERRGGRTCFAGYGANRDGTPGVAERNKLFRNAGDCIAAINGNLVYDVPKRKLVIPFAGILDLLRKSAAQKISVKLLLCDLQEKSWPPEERTILKSNATPKNPTDASATVPPATSPPTPKMASTISATLSPATVTSPTPPPPKKATATSPPPTPKKASTVAATVSPATVTSAPPPPARKSATHAAAATVLPATITSPTPKKASTVAATVSSATVTSAPPPTPKSATHAAAATVLPATITSPTPKNPSNVAATVSPAAVTSAPPPAAPPPTAPLQAPPAAGPTATVNPTSSMMFDNRKGGAMEILSIIEAQVGGDAAASSISLTIRQRVDRLDKITFGTENPQSGSLGDRLRRLYDQWA